MILQLSNSRTGHILDCQPVFI